MLENTLVDSQGVPYAKLYSSTFNLGAKATGQPFSKFVAGPPQAKKVPQREPDWIIKDQTSPEQAIVFRINQIVHLTNSCWSCCDINIVIMSIEV